MLGECLRSGYCCKVAPCRFGWPQRGRHRCVFLGGPRPGYHFCMIHLWIETQPGSELEPAFGAGCCSSMNSTRQEIIRRSLPEPSGRK